MSVGLWSDAKHGDRHHEVSHPGMVVLWWQYFPNDAVLIAPQVDGPTALPIAGQRVAEVVGVEFQVLQTGLNLTRRLRVPTLDILEVCDRLGL